MIRTVFLDLDDTILDFRKGEKESLRQTLVEFGMEPKEEVLELYHEINKRQWELLEEGKLTREQVLLRRYELLFEQLGLSCDAAAVCRRYEGHLAESVFFVAGAEELLRQLHGKYALYLASNGSSHVQHNRLKLSGIESFFDGLMISQELGADKPSAAFFEAAFQQIPDFDRESAIIVGDSLTSDIRGGKNAGIRTCWFNPQGAVPKQGMEPDYTIASLAELPGLLEQL